MSSANPILSADLDVREPADLDPLGIVGARELIALQTFDISSLTSHPVPIVPRMFVAVTGIGPRRDSNGSGKSSFLGATSLLLGDPQWGLNNDGRQARNLMFNPASAGLDVNLGFRPAEVAYIAGVFAPTPTSPARECLTVWMRLQATAPFITTRWITGVHLADEGDDSANLALADGLWRAMPPANEIGPRSYVQKMFGDSARCLAYLDANIRKSSKSLLSQAFPQYTPEEIAEALIGLTGRDTTLEAEENQRAKHDRASTDLIARREEDAEATRRETQGLASARHRDQARAHLETGTHEWQLHYAAGLLDSIEKDRVVAQAIETAEERVADAQNEVLIAKARVADLSDMKELQSDFDVKRRAFDELEAKAKELGENRAVHVAGMTPLTENVERLRALADEHDGRTVEQALHELTTAGAALERARDSERDMVRAVQAAEDGLAQAEAGAGGDAGATLDALAAADIAAAGLLDAITLPADARAAWEPRLWPYRHAALICAQDHEAALRALRELPGAMLVLTDGPLGTDSDGPDGITTAAPIRQFLEQVAARTQHETDPDRAVDHDLSHVTLGGFALPVTGADARIERARDDLNRAGDLLVDAQGAARLALARRDMADRIHQGAVAAAELPIARHHRDTTAAAIATIDETLIAMRSQREKAEDEKLEAQLRVLNHEQMLNQARGALTSADNALSLAREDLNKHRSDRAQSQTDWYLRRWGGTSEAARAALDANGSDLSAKRWRNRANEELSKAITAYRLAMDMVVPAALESAIDARARAGTDDIAVDTFDFDTVATPLRDLLEETRENDQRLERETHREQDRRRKVIGESQTELDAIQRELNTLQQAIHSRVHHSLTSISDAFGALDLQRGGFGARLTVEGTAPAGPSDPWRWRVTPEWKRSKSSPFVPYHQQANSAQVKVAAIQLVLAALLAGERASGRVLILDELGDSLGEVNRRDVLEAIGSVAQAQGVTILGTCQDDVLPAAVRVCGQLLYFEHPSENDAYNLPTSAWGFDDRGEHVRLTARFLRAGREF